MSRAGRVYDGEGDGRQQTEAWRRQDVESDVHEIDAHPARLSSCADRVSLFPVYYMRAISECACPKSSPRESATAQNDHAALV